MVKSVSSVLFDASRKYHSPFIPSEERILKYDDSGNAVVSYGVLDSASVQRSLGNVSDWSIDSLLKVGINPRFPINTSFASRIDGVSQVESAAAYAETLVLDVEDSKD